MLTVSVVDGDCGLTKACAEGHYAYYISSGYGRNISAKICFNGDEYAFYIYGVSIKRCLHTSMHKIWRVLDRASSELMKDCCFKLNNGQTL